MKIFLKCTLVLLSLLLLIGCTVAPPSEENPAPENNPPSEENPAPENHPPSEENPTPEDTPPSDSPSQKEDAFSHQYEEITSCKRWGKDENKADELSRVDVDILLMVMNSGERESDITKTGYDFEFIVSGATIRYTSSMGLFNDITHKCHFRVTEQQMELFNRLLEDYFS